MTIPRAVLSVPHYLASLVDFPGIASIIDIAVNDMDILVQKEAFALLKPFLDDGWSEPDPRARAILTSPVYRKESRCHCNRDEQSLR